MTDQPITEVIIDTPGPTITVRAAADLHTVAAVATILFDHAAQRHAVERDQIHGAGFTTDRRESPDAQPSSMALAPQLTDSEFKRWHAMFGQTSGGLS
jgi:hypothetical protein